MLYRLHYDKMSDDFIELNQEKLKDIQLPCITSQFQKINKNPIEVETSDELGGMIFPDFIYDGAVPLFSEKVYDSMKNAGVDNLFEKEVTVVDNLQDISKKYILGLPPRIRVINSSDSIDENRIGNYLIFKIADKPDNNIYIVEKLARVLKKIKPVGMEIIEVNVL